MTDENNAASTEPAATDLDSILSNAIETHIPDDAPAAEPAAEATPEPKADHPSDPTRYADGTFKAKTDPAAPAASQEPTAEAAKPATPAPEPALQPLEAPTRWPADKKAQFAQWPRDVQESVLERIKEQEADYTRKTQEAAELRRSAEPIVNAIKPFEQYLAQLQPITRQTPDQMIASLLGAEYQLRTGNPQQKVQALYQIAAEYQIDLAAIARGEMPPAPDPAFNQLRQSFGSVEQRLAAIEQEREAERQRQTAQQIEDFANAKDAQGKPLRPHFTWARAAMGKIIGDDPSLTLEQAYQKAIEPLNAALAQELQARQTQADQQRQEAVDKARKVAPVKSTGSQPNGSAKGRDLDSILSAAIDARM